MFYSLGMGEDQLTTHEIRYSNGKVYQSESFLEKHDILHVVIHDLTNDISYAE